MTYEIEKTEGRRDERMSMARRREEKGRKKHNKRGADQSDSDTRIKVKRRHSWLFHTIRLLFHLLWLPALSAACIVVGLVVGYSVVGGEPVKEVFSRELWQHLYNLVYAD